MDAFIVPQLGKSKTSGIYIIYRKKSNQMYIGQASDIQRRWASHILMLRKNQHHCTHLQHAWNKYGQDSFAFAVIEDCLVDRLNERESAYLEAFSGSDILYNIGIFAGAAMRGRKRSPQSIEKFRQSMMGRVVSDETRAKISAANTGKVHSSESIERQRKAMTGRKRSVQSIEKFRQTRIGYSVSDETKEKIRNAHLGKKNGPHSDERKEKISKANMGRLVSDETRRKISEANKGTKPSPLAIERSRKTRTGNKATDETKEKMRQARLGKPTGKKGEPWTKARRDAHDKGKINL